MRIRFTAFALFILLFLNTCDVTTEKLEIEIRGRVSSASGGSPIQEADVVLKEYFWLEDDFELARVSTDENGHYRLKHRFDNRDECAEDRLVLEVTKYGYFMGMFAPTDERRIECHNDVQTIDFQLIRIGKENRLPPAAKEKTTVHHNMR